MARPWMPLYGDDYMADTAHLSRAEHGAYWLLIMHYWRQGELPADDRELATISKSTLAQWKRFKPTFLNLMNGNLKYSQCNLDKMMAIKGWGYGLRPEYCLNVLPVEWPNIRKEIFKRDNYTCSYCGGRGGQLECDHIVPRSKGGDHSPGNLTTACRPCNRAKRDKTAEEWLQ